MSLFKKNNKIDFSRIEDKLEQSFNDLPMVKERKRMKYFYSITKWFGFFVLFILTILIVFIVINFFTFKNIYDVSINDKANLKNSLDLLKMQEFSESISSANLAKANFNEAVAEIEKIKNSTFNKYFNLLENRFNDLEYLFVTGDFVSRALIQGAVLGQELENLLDSEKKITYSKFNELEKRRILEKLYQSTPELTGIKANLELALINLKKVQTSLIFLPIKHNIGLATTQLNSAHNLLSQAIPFTQLLPELAGYPELSRYLVVLQNNDELRPTGGFIGTYGILEIENGDISNFETHDVYHLDMPIQNKLDVKPPEPLVKYLGVDKWYMRDANWSPDWPRSAEQILWFYEKESVLNNNEIKPINGVIAITPDFIMDLMRFTGPITIDDIEFNAQNFQELLQYQVEQGYTKIGVPKWHRKEIIGDIARKLKIKLFDSTPNQWNELLSIAEKNMMEKNVIFYLKNSDSQDIIREQGWAGEIKNTTGDYLMVVDANMAAFKTDAVVDKNIDYKINQKTDGLYSDLTIHYSHQGGFDWRTTRYRTYTRIYVPLGSQLIDVDGITDGAIEVYNELGKTCFAGFISVEPGKIGQLHFNYKLPYDLTNINQYSLYIQKQPGSRINELLVDLSFLNRVKSYSPATLSTSMISEKEVSWQTDLTTDKLFIINF